jgi:hypothetical protein
MSTAEKGELSLYQRQFDALVNATKSFRSRLSARVITFAALVLGGVGLLALITVWHVRWVLPVTVYALFVQWGLAEFFDAE